MMFASKGCSEGCTSRWLTSVPITRTNARCANRASTCRAWITSPRDTCTITTRRARLTCRGDPAAADGPRAAPTATRTLSPRRASRSPTGRWTASSSCTCWSTCCRSTRRWISWRASRSPGRGGEDPRRVRSPPLTACPWCTPRVPPSSFSSGDRLSGSRKPPSERTISFCSVVLHVLSPSVLAVSQFYR